MRSVEKYVNAEGYLNIEKRKSKLIKMLLNRVYMHNTYKHTYIHTCIRTHTQLFIYFPHGNSDFITFRKYKKEICQRREKTLLFFPNIC